MTGESHDLSGGKATDSIVMPAPTSWPIVLAFGLALLLGGLVTSAAVSVLGAILAIAGCVGWFRDVLPHEAHETAKMEQAAPQPVSLRLGVARAEISQENRRAWLPVEIHPVSAGIKGGLAGSLAMAALAMVYGVLSGHSIWYPINLLVAGFLPSAMTASTARLTAFHPEVFLIAIPIHLVTSLLVGLLYGAMLPMLPRRPILLGGFIAPIMWSGLIFGILDVVNPVLNRRISWLWFVISQMGFGIVAGIVVSRTQKVRTRQGMPLSLMAGLESPGIMERKHREDKRP